MHFEGSYIHLGIKDGPRIRIPISSMQSNALVVGDSNPENKNRGINNKSYKKFNSAQMYFMIDSTDRMEHFQQLKHMIYGKMFI